MYIEKVLEWFGMTNSKLVGKPLLTQIRLSTFLSPQNDEEEQFMSSLLYSSVVGGISYAMICTRSGISQAMKWLLRYFKGTSHLSLVFDKETTNYFFHNRCH